MDAEPQSLEAMWLASVEYCAGGRFKVDADAPKDIEVDASIAARSKSCVTAKVNTMANHKMALVESTILSHATQNLGDSFQELPAVRTGINPMHFPQAQEAQTVAIRGGSLLQH